MVSASQSALATLLLFGPGLLMAEALAEPPPGFPALKEHVPRPRDATLQQPCTPCDMEVRGATALGSGTSAVNSTADGIRGMVEAGPAPAPGTLQ